MGEARVVKILASDIRAERLDVDKIRLLPVKTVYEWVRTGIWKPADFKRWLEFYKEF
jgi:hypothetical protein